MKKSLSIIILLLSILMACQDDWKDYYRQSEEKENSETGTASGNLLEQLKQKTQYSEFVKLLEETGVSKELIRNQILTIWAPTNSSIPQEQIATLSKDDKITLCKNHINYIALYTTKLNDNKQITMLSNKNLVINEPQTDHFTIDQIAVTQSDIIASNGVIHEIDQWLMPRKNLYEYLLTAGAEYSIFRDSLLSYSDTIFKPSQSYPIGTDELGNTIYDSVFVIENVFFNTADLRNENKEFTFFLPSNKVIKNMYADLNQIYETAGKPLTQKDSSTFFQWVLKAVIAEGKIENYSGVITSAFKAEWRTDKQLVEPDFKTCSNGLLYDVTKLHIPAYLYQTSMQSYVYSLAGAPNAKWEHCLCVNSNINNALADGFTWNNGSNVKPYACVWINTSSKANATFEFDTYTTDAKGKVIEGKISPGAYDFYSCWRTASCSNVLLEIKTTNPDIADPEWQTVGTFNFGDAKYNSDKNEGKGGLLLKNFVIPEEWGTHMVRIRITNTGKSSRMTPISFTFEPAKDNY